ncbi:NADP-dependent malic enzyme [Candidatus Peregrinibacteria bacterium]|nr:NADP-dependent malic enzyme [Candidatus Peregrinibacteria bacterium]
MILNKMANMDAWPIALNVHYTNEIVATIKAIAPGFAGINLEDIAAPQCFEIEEALQDLGIPVMHDDQHGTAIVVYAALLNAAKVLGKDLSTLKVVINGAGAAGLATARMLLDLDQTGNAHVNNLIICDSKGIINQNRSDLNPYKLAILKHSNHENLSGDLSIALAKADVFIGLSAPGVLTAEMIKSMSPNPIIFALANPIPEIYPDEAMAAGAAIIGTGRSDFPNQINNALVFPGIFRAAINNRQTRITPAMKYAAAHGIAKTITTLSKEAILPTLFSPGLTDNILDEIKKSLS